jgi:hypothetical protein
MSGAAGAAILINGKYCGIYGYVSSALADSTQPSNAILSSVTASGYTISCAYPQIGQIDSTTGLCFNATGGYLSATFFKVS